MENRSLIKQTPLESGNIDYGSYTLSLMQEALRVGLLGEADLTHLQTQLLTLLRGQIGGITHGESTSVPVETADGLMDGIGYCIDLTLKNAPDLQQSIALLQTKTMPELYHMGKDLLSARARACHSLLARVRSTRTPTVNAGYQMVLDSTLPQLLREWDANPYPADFAVIMEYPLAVEETLDGIFGIHARLSDLALENRFCARFADAPEALLIDYARQNRVSPADAYVNLFTLVLQNLLLNRLLGRDGWALSRADMEELQTQLAPLTSAQRGQLLLHCAAALLTACAFENERLDAYVLAGASRFAAAIEGDNLPALAVIHREEAPLLHTDGERLTDAAFAEVTDEILLCDTAAGKVQILRDELHSLEDLCDMLAADCLFDDEYQVVFKSFDPPTRALLLTKIPVDLREDQFFLQGDTEWQLRFVRFLNALPPKERFGSSAL